MHALISNLDIRLTSEAQIWDDFSQPLLRKPVVIIEIVISENMDNRFGWNLDVSSYVTEKQSGY